MLEQGGWTRWTWDISSSLNHSVILWKGSVLGQIKIFRSGQSRDELSYRAYNKSEIFEVDLKEAESPCRKISAIPCGWLTLWWRKKIFILVYHEGQENELCGILIYSYTNTDFWQFARIRIYKLNAYGLFRQCSETTFTTLVGQIR